MSHHRFKFIVFIIVLYLTLFDRNVVMASEMVLVQGGEFIMGNTSGDGSEAARPAHQVKLRNYYIGKFEVTFDEYDAFCDANGKEKPVDDDNDIRGLDPVMHVSWYDAVSYCNWKSIQDGLKPCYYSTNGVNVLCDFNANGYRLPTEAEWEYAARGGNLSKGYKYIGSNNPDEVAWYWDNSQHRTHPVGQKMSNELGIYDMGGNNWEWCWDWYEGTKYYNYCLGLGTVENPTGPKRRTDGGRVMRGGGCNSYAEFTTSYKRGGMDPLYKYGGGIGFRLARIE